jgi:hypothetical protein
MKIESHRMASKYYPYLKGHRQMEELDYKAHSYSECELVDKDCDECERYYWEEIHADFCDETCPQRYEDIDELLDLGRCHGCTCEHCDSEANSFEVKL